jgi:Nucleotide-diphospho-sugar transferase
VYRLYHRAQGWKKILMHLASPAQEIASELTNLSGGQRYVVCAFFTPNYLEQALSLKASLDALGLNYFFKRYERAASWEATTRIKPVFVDYCLSRFPQHDVLYLDADAVVRKVPTFFDTVTSDVCLLFNAVKSVQTYYLRIAAGTVLVRNTEGGRRFAQVWKAEETNASMLSRDEDLIYMAMSKLEGVSFTALPQAYIKIFDSPKLGPEIGPDAEPVIEHFQASRTQFKWRRAFWQTGRVVAAISVIAVLIVLHWVTKHLVWVA